MVLGPHDERPKADATSAGNGSSRHTCTDRILKRGIERALVVVDAADASGVLAFDWLEHAATRCAQDGVPIEVVHAAVTESVMSALDQHGSVSNAIDEGWNIWREPAAPASILDDLIAVVSRAYG